MPAQPRARGENSGMNSANLLPRRFAGPVMRGQFRVVDLLIIHCSASPNGRSLFHGDLGDADFKTPVATIDDWHRARGFARKSSDRALQNQSLTSIGYHYVIYLDGTVATGRGVNEVGAHCRGWNSQSLGICLVGTDAFTEKQWDSLKYLVGKIEEEATKKPAGALWIRGHRDMPDVHKECPGFSVDAWLAGGRKALAGHVYVKREM